MTDEQAQELLARLAGIDAKLDRLLERASPLDAVSRHEIPRYVGEWPRRRDAMLPEGGGALRHALPLTPYREEGQ